MLWQALARDHAIWAALRHLFFIVLTWAWLFDRESCARHESQSSAIPTAKPTKQKKVPRVKSVGDVGTSANLILATHDNKPNTLCLRHAWPGDGRGRPRRENDAKDGGLLHMMMSIGCALSEAVALMEAGGAGRARISLVHPANSPVWEVERLEAARRRRGFEYILYDSCAFGTPWRGATRVLTNTPAGLRPMGRRCRCGRARPAQTASARRASAASASLAARPL